MKLITLEEAYKLKQEGKPVYFRYRNDDRDKWIEINAILDNTLDVIMKYEFAVKPTPTLRPWRPEEVPVGALLRHRTVTFVRSPVTLILSVRGAWIGFVCAETFKLTDMLCENINKSYEHSLDHGKTWLPCGVAE